MSDGVFPDRVAQLRARWEADPSSRIFLQLAEEYRHQGRVRDALEVLDRGLKEHPGYLSALVARGRCLLELGEPEQARAVLERVVKQDATQMVANKLLVRAYLETGEPERARERLDLYTLLNDGDPEAEDLRRRIAALESPAPPAAPAENDFDLFDLGPAAAAPPPAAARPGEDPFDDLLAPAPAAPPAAPAAPAPAPEDDLLFPELAAARPSRDRYLAALASEGLFTQEEQRVEPAAVEAAAPVATATLGELYLRQGHREEAERIFQEVLEREPGNAAARSGLSKLAAAPPAPRPLHARDLLAGLPPGASDTARKAHVLNRYLERLRAGSRPHVS